MAATVASQVRRKVPVDHTTPPTAATAVATSPATSSAVGAARRGQRRRGVGPPVTAGSAPRSAGRRTCQTTRATVAASQSQPDGNSDHWVASPRQ